VSKRLILVELDGDAVGDDLGPLTVREILAYDLGRLGVRVRTAPVEVGELR
jgi:hypothetical protein